MRRTCIHSARPGMVLARPVLGGAGQVLLNRGIEIKPQHLTYLKRLGIHYLYVYDSRLEDVEIDDVISEETRQEARALVKEVMRNVQNPGNQKKGILVDDTRVVQTVSKIVEELLESRHMLAQLMDIRSLDDYLFAHSVNSTVLATLVATKMNYKEETLKALATGALLHDIGIVTIPENILNKKSELTTEEYERVKQHPAYGYEIFKKNPLYSNRAGSVILQHHERYQGQGYPLGLQGERIDQLAQIVGIADAYDALTSDRPYRKAYQAHQAVEMLLSWGGELFDPDVLSKFLCNIAAYPVGTHVFLNNGENGLVVANTPGFTLRPVVRVLYTGEDMAPHPSPYDLDLSEVLDITIVKAFD